MLQNYYLFFKNSLKLRRTQKHKYAWNFWWFVTASYSKISKDMVAYSLLHPHIGHAHNCEERKEGKDGQRHSSIWRKICAPIIYSRKGWLEQHIGLKMLLWRKMKTFKRRCFAVSTRFDCPPTQEHLVLYVTLQEILSNLQPHAQTRSPL